MRRSIREHEWPLLYGQAREFQGLGKDIKFSSGKKFLGSPCRRGGECGVGECIQDRIAASRADEIAVAALLEDAAMLEKTIRSISSAWRRS